jgi:hypothetical protein
MLAFYNSWSVQRSGLIAWAGTRIKLYSLADPKPRVPLRDESLGITGTHSAAGMPLEVALCLSFQAPKVSGQEQRRRRGRVYLGPFTNLSGDGSTGRPDATAITAITTAAQTLLDASQASSSWKWAVIHDANGVAPVAHVVENGWLDNAWDTQRRRGNAPGVRTTFS